MSLIVTPGQLQQRAELYHQLGALLSAGVTLTQALQMLERNPPARNLRPFLSAVRIDLEQGDTFCEAVGKQGSQTPSFDRALLEAGEQSGRLDACFKLLSIYYNDRARMIRSVISDLMYPAFLFHFSVVLFPFIGFFKTGDLLRFVSEVVAILAPIYVLIFLLIVACQGRHGERWRSVIEKTLHSVPILGRARRSLALGRLAAAMEALINAGVPIIGAWEMAATASGSPALRRRIHKWKLPLEQGSTPAELMSSSPEFPELFANLYASGEMSGKTDETLKRLHLHYQEEGSRKLHHVAKWTPQLVYFAVIIVVAIKVISFYTGYFGQLQEIMK